MQNFVQLICAWICATDGAFWFLSSTPFTARHRTPSTLTHLAASGLWFGLALWVLIDGGNGSRNNNNSNGPGWWELDGAGAVLTVNLLVWSFLTGASACLPYQASLARIPNPDPQALTRALTRALAPTLTVAPPPSRRRTWGCCTHRAGR